MKKCTDCGETKPLTDFYERKKGSGLYKSECRACSTARARAWNDKNPDRAKASRSRYRARNLGAHAARQAQYRKRTYIPSGGFEAVSKRPHTLYRAYDSSGRLLYVGISVDPKRRLAQHRREKDWWPEVDRVAEEVWPDRASAQEAETLAVQSEGPVHNIRKVSRPYTGH